MFEGQWSSSHFHLAVCLLKEPLKENFFISLGDYKRAGVRSICRVREGQSLLFLFLMHHFAVTSLLTFPHLQEAESSLLNFPLKRMFLAT